MASTERVTVTLPSSVLDDIDRREGNRSKFVLDAVRHELERRRRDELHRSLRAPHSESEVVAELGMADWANGLPAEETSELVDLTAGKAVRWTAGKGWAEVEE